MGPSFLEFNFYTGKGNGVWGIPMANRKAGKRLRVWYNIQVQSLIWEREVDYRKLQGDNFGSGDIHFTNSIFGCASSR